ncbi:SPRY domain-containing SOCS box protein 3 [Eupeodes corollae]|uniref:SPRY domain-containing SOCS box protein 3 n=1 Tax=Eupeodes corollae TaxID=290404 RepID=UPI002490F539|nr:SPRY domain-containing SOCS box protein 3 [Eupeodes corollae]
MSSGHLIKSHLQEPRSPPFCDCPFPKCTAITAFKGNIPDLVTCRCGEEDCNTMEWQWDHSDPEKMIHGPDITFHPIYSQGTTIVRGDKPLKPQMVHFWEIRIITILSGTDVMFGIGTDKVNVDEFKHHFVSALGTNRESWGFSYNGMKQHNGSQIQYGSKFSQGCIIGVYLDLTRGHLEFFLNRRSLGIAYTNIPIDPNIQIYPMVCSTSAKSAIRLINSTSQSDCLQLRAFKALSKQPTMLAELKEMPGLRSILKSYWFFVPPTRYSIRSTHNEFDLGDEAVLSSSRLSRKQKFKDEEPDINDLYTNAHKIALHSKDSDDEFSVDDFFYYLF